MSDVVCPNRALWDRLSDRSCDFTSDPWLVVGHRQGARWTSTAAYMLVQWSRVLRETSCLADMLDELIRVDPSAELWLEDSASLACSREEKSGLKIRHLDGVLPGSASSDVNPVYGRMSMRRLAQFLDLTPFEHYGLGVGLYQHVFVRGEEDDDESDDESIGRGRRARRTAHRRRGLRRERPVFEEA